MSILSLTILSNLILGYSVACGDTDIRAGFAECKGVDRGCQLAQAIRAPRKVWVHLAICTRFTGCKDVATTPAISAPRIISKVPQKYLRLPSTGTEYRTQRGNPPNSPSTLRNGVCWRVWLAACGKWGAATPRVTPRSSDHTFICTQCRSLPSAASTRAFIFFLSGQSIFSPRYFPHPLIRLSMLCFDSG